MDITVTLQTITIRDDESGETFTVRTLRTAKEIAGYVEESEKDEITDTLEEKVIEAY